MSSCPLVDLDGEVVSDGFELSEERYDVFVVVVWFEVAYVEEYLFESCRVSSAKLSERV